MDGYLKRCWLGKNQIALMLTIWYDFKLHKTRTIMLEGYGKLYASRDYGKLPNWRRKES